MTLKNRVNSPKKIFLMLAGLFFGITASNAQLKSTSHFDKPITSDFIDVSKIAPSNQLKVQSRSFASFEDLGTFAKANLNAELIYKKDKLAGIKSSYVQKGAITLKDETGKKFKQNDFVVAYLGGRKGIVKIGGKAIPLINNSTGKTLFITPVENCISDDCITGESWINHNSFLGFGYHSAGSKTIQSNGGQSAVSYNCCSSGGTLINLNGQRQCRYRNSDAWEFDVSIKEWIPVDINQPLYIYRPLQQCSYQALRNQISARAIFITDPNSILGSFVCGDCDKTLTNEKEVKVGESLITAPGFDFGPYYIDDIVGVCGEHYSSRGGSVNSSIGNTEGVCE